MLFKKPLEVKLLLTANCNYKCSFCFGKNTKGKRKLSSANAKKVIKKIAAEGIEKVRFTGGEPLLRKDLPELLKFAKRQGLYVMLNTNASLLNGKSTSVISKFCDEILVSFNAFSPGGEALLQGSPKGRQFFQKKLDAMEKLFSPCPKVRVSTVLTKNNIQNLQKFSQVLDSTQVSGWALLRPIPCPSNPMPVSSRDTASAVEKILAINRGGREESLIENALPFCSYTPKKVSSVAVGGINEDGNSKLVVDANATIKPSYFLNVSLGSALDDSFSSAWNSRFMQKLHSLEFIAPECHKCRFLHKCRSGSRFSALFANKSLYALDPLAQPGRFSAELF